MERARGLAHLVIVADRPSRARVGAAYIAGVLSGLLASVILFL